MQVGQGSILAASNFLSILSINGDRKNWTQKWKITLVKILLSKEEFNYHTTFSVA